MVFDLGQRVAVPTTSSGSGDDDKARHSNSNSNSSSGSSGNGIDTNIIYDLGISDVNASNDVKDTKKKRRKRLISFDLGCSNSNSLNVISPSQFMRRNRNSAYSNNPHPYHNSFRTSDDDCSGDNFNGNDEEVGVRIRSRRLHYGNIDGNNDAKLDTKLDSRMSTGSTNSSMLENSFVESTMSETPSEEEAHIRAIQIKVLRSKNSNGDGDSPVGDDDSHDPLNVSRVEFNMNNSVAVSELHPLSDMGDSDHIHSLLVDGDDYDCDSENENEKNNRKGRKRGDNTGSYRIGNTNNPVRAGSSGVIDLGNLSGASSGNSPGNVGTRFRNNSKKKEGYVKGNSTDIDTTTTNRNRNIMTNLMNNNNQDDYQEEDDGQFSLQPDIFTILFVSPIFSFSFLYGLIIYIFQLTILSLATINLLRDHDSGNRLKIPLYVNLEVFFAQFLAIIVSVFTAQDILHAMDILQVQYDVAILDAFPSATVGKWYASNLLRFIEGLMGLLVSFFFIVQSEDVLDLFLDFTVVQFVSELDDFGFYLAEKGYSFINIKKVARLIRRIKFRHVDYVNICGTRRVIPTTVSQRVLFTVTLTSLFSSWGFVQYLQRTGYYYQTVCQNFEVKFDAFELDYFRDHCNSNNTCPPSWIGRTEPIRYTSFNDVYQAQMKDDGSIVLHNNRPIYHQRGLDGFNAFGDESPGGTFYYCLEVEAWVFTIEGVTKGSNDQNDSSCDWLMKSMETQAHSLHEVETEGWIVWTGILKVVEDFSISCIECQGNEDTKDVMCTYHGKCVEERCDCEDDWMGTQCETCASCHMIEMMFGDENLSSITKTYLHRMDEDDSSTVRGSSPYQVYGRPVYYKGDAEGNIDPSLEIVLYAGRRYVIWDLKEDDHVSIDDDLEDVRHFLDTLHSTWDFDTKAKLSFASEPTDNPMPFGLSWFDSLNREVDIKLSCPNEEEKSRCFFFFN